MFASAVTHARVQIFESLENVTADPRLCYCGHAIDPNHGDRQVGSMCFVVAVYQVLWSIQNNHLCLAVCEALLCSFGSSALCRDTNGLSLVSPTAARGL